MLVKTTCCSPLFTRSNAPPPFHRNVVCSCSLTASPGPPSSRPGSPLETHARRLTFVSKHGRQSQRRRSSRCCRCCCRCCCRSSLGKRRRKRKRRPLRPARLARVLQGLRRRGGAQRQRHEQGRRGRREVKRKKPGGEALFSKPLLSRRRLPRNSTHLEQKKPEKKTPSK